MFSSQFLTVCALLLLPLVFFILRHRTPSSSRRKALPPGPKPWPIIGNLLDMGEKLHLSLAHFSQLYGPLISLRLGSDLLVVASSPMAAKEILKNHNRLLFARHVPNGHPLSRPDCNRISLIWATKCTDQWKLVRNLCRNELFSAKAIESQAGLREKKVGDLLGFLGKNEGKVVNIGEMVFTTIFNIFGNLVFSKDFIRWEDEWMASGMKGLFSNMTKFTTVPNISDFYPMLGRFDLQGLRKETTKCFEEMFGVWEDLVRERKHSQTSSRNQRDLLDVFLARRFSDEQINMLALEIFVAGVETSTSTIEWAMAELLKSRECMEKLCEELNGEIKGSTIKECHISQLPYLNACVKETLRLHPPLPLFPRRPPEMLEILNYTIPKNSQVAVNVWAMGRDPGIWEEPLSFKPERFLCSKLDFKGQNFEFLPFGAGRRMCPGMPMANMQVNLILASLVHYFKWSLPTNEDPFKLDMNEKLGVTLQKEKPLLVIAKRAM